MEMIGQFHALTALTLEDDPHYPLDRRQIGCRVYLERGIIPSESRNFAIEPLD
jgi:hypothetical protein